MNNQDLNKFNIWNEMKKSIHLKQVDFFIKNREMWFVSLWQNIWFEEDWKQEFKRPVLVIKKVWNMFFVIPLTSKWKQENIFYHKMKTAIFNENNQKYKDSSFCILSQVKVIDKKRFLENIWYVKESEFIEIKEKLKELLL